jgi:hypothetical protein
LARDLRSIGIAHESVLGLGADDSGVGLEVEDLLDPEIYAAAVTEELRSWPPHTGLVSARELPSSKRTAFVAARCAALGRSAPSKPNVAAEVLRAIEGTGPGQPPMSSSIGDAKYVERLRQLHLGLCRTLCIP